MNEQNQNNNEWNTTASPENAPQQPESYVQPAMPQQPEGYVQSVMPQQSGGYVQSAMPQQSEGHAQPAPMEASYQNYTSPQPYAQPFPYQPQPAPKSKKGLWIGLGIGGVLIVALLLIGILFATGMLDVGRTNAEKLWAAILKNNEITKAEMFQELVLDEWKQGEGFYGSLNYFSLFNGAGIKLHTKVDMASESMEADVRVMLKGLEFLDILYQRRGQDHIVSIPKLVSQAFYFSKEGIGELVEENGMASQETADAVMESFSAKNIEKSLKYLRSALNPMTLPEFKKLDEKKYLERVRDYYDALIKVERGSQKLNVNGEEKEFKGDVYEINENLGDTAEFYFSLLKDLLADENFKPFVEAYLERLIAEMEKNQDLLLYNYLTVVSGSFEMKTAWDDDIKAELVYIKELILDRLDRAAEEMAKPHTATEAATAFELIKQSGSTMNMVFVVDKRVIYSNIEVALALKELSEGPSEIDFVRYHVTTGLLAINDDVKLSAFESEKAFDFAAAGPEDMMKLYEELQQNAQKIGEDLGLF